MPEPQRRRMPLGLTIALGASVGVAALVGWVDSSPYTHGQALMPARPMPEARLTGRNDEPLDLLQFKGQWLLLYFGFTYCPDVCPAALENLAATLDRLKADDRYVQVVFVSIDPGRDTPKGADSFASYFHTDFLGATGSEAEVGKLIRAAGTPYPFARNPASDAPDPSLHPASIFVVNPEGQLVAKYDDDTPPADLIRDLTPLLTD